MSVKAIIKSIWANDSVRHFLHTVWQVGVPFLISQLLLVKSTADVKTAFIATGAVVLAAIKAALVARS